MTLTGDFHLGEGGLEMKKLLLVVLCLALMAGTAFADRTVTVTKLSSNLEIQTLDLGGGGMRDCLVGNLNDPAWAINGWFTGQEEYKFLFNGAECCNEGFWLDTVHIYLQFTDTMTYPLEILAWVDLEDALWDDALGCWVPGIVDCVSAVYTVTIEAPGLYDIGLPMTDYCDCAYVYDPTGSPYWYMLSVHFDNLFDAQLVTDDFPVGCMSWNNWGAGWYDLVNDAGFPGEIMIWGDVHCCEDPVGMENETWGGVKALFR